MNFAPEYPHSHTKLVSTCLSNRAHSTSSNLSPAIDAVHAQRLAHTVPELTHHQTEAHSWSQWSSSEMLALSSTPSRNVRNCVFSVISTFLDISNSQPIYYMFPNCVTNLTVSFYKKLLLCRMNPKSCSSMIWLICIAGISKLLR